MDLIDETYICMYVCMHVCIYVYTYVCMYVCMYVCIQLQDRVDLIDELALAARFNINLKKLVTKPLCD